MEVVVVLFSAFYGCGSATLPAGDPTRPDVILVSIDSLRPDHLGSYGNARQPSPFLDGLASAGLRYTEARAHSPWTLPSHTTMLSGRGPLEHEVVEDTRRIPADLPLVQEALGGAGYSTAGFVTTVYVSDTFGFERGFSHFEDYGIGRAENLKRTVNAETVVDDALTWARTAEGKPVFLFLHFYDVHYPYLPPEPWNLKYDKPGSKKSTRYRSYEWTLKNPLSADRLAHLQAQYDESIAYVDDQLARLGAAWAKSGRRVSWVVTADHGEEFGEHGGWGHAHTLHPEVMRVPLVVSGAGVDTPAVREERVGVVDVAATLAGLAGVPFPSSGVDVRGAVPVRDQVFETSRFDSARLGLWSAGRRIDLDFTRDAQVVYGDVDADESTPLAADPALEALAWAAVGERWTATGPVTTRGWLHAAGVGTTHRWDGPGPFALYPPDALVDGPATRAAAPPSVTLTEDTREQLRALGYEQ